MKYPDLSKQLFADKRYELFWTDGEVQGTCFDENHGPELKLKNTIFRGMKKIPVASQFIRNEVLLNRTKDKIFGWSEFAKYCNPESSGRNWNGGFEELKDCLWKIQYGTDKVYDYLRFSSWEDLIDSLRENFLNTSGKLEKTLIIEAYFLEDNEINYPYKMTGFNAAWGALRGNSAKKAWRSHVDFNGLGGDTAKIDSILTDIWTYLKGAPPPAHTTEQLSRAFYLNNSMKGNNIYKPIVGTLVGGLGINRLYWDGAAWSDTGGSINLNTSNVGIFRVNIVDGTVHRINDYTSQYQSGREDSLLLAIHTDGGVFIKPFSVDTIYLPWFDTNDYEVKITSYRRGKSPNFHTPDEVVYNYNNQNLNCGCRLKSPDWMEQGWTQRESTIQRKYLFRYHKKNTPFLSRPSDSYLTALSGNEKCIPSLVLQHN